MSDTPDWQRVRTLFHDAVALSDTARARYLDQHCQADEALRGEVESLLAAHGNAEGFLDVPTGQGLDRGVSVSLEPGARCGRFEIRDMLGAGGMGEVYRACDTRLGRDVALKLLSPGLAADPDRRARLERESRLLATLNHPHIASIHGVEDIDGRLALVLELVDGPTLADRLASGPLAPIEALQIARDLAEALEAAHGNAVVHRDLKPANVKIGPTGAVKLLDFGLAKSVPGEADARVAHAAASVAEPRTHDGLILGTVAYMSPEQARGQHVDKRTDIWAFGCVLYEMLSGRRAFSGETISDTIAAVLNQEPDWTALPAEIAPDVRALIRRCLQKNPNRRLHDIADARLVIDDALQPSDPLATVPARVGPSNRATLAAVGAALTIGGIVLAIAAWRLPGLFADRPPVPSLTYLTLALPDGVGLHSAPAVSPDGSAIAFVGRNGTLARLYVRPLTSPDVRAIPGTEGASQPFWSPDGQWLAFFARGKLKKVAVNGGAPMDICSVSEARGGSWGSAGVIVFTPHLIDAPLYRVSAEGGRPVAVTELDESRGDNSHRWPVFLPDGVHFLYFIRSSEDGRRGVYLGRADGPATRPGERLVESESEAHYVALASDSMGDLITTVAAGIQIQRFDATTRRLVGPPRVLDLRVGASTTQERSMLSATRSVLARAPMPITNSNRLASAARDGSGVQVWPEYGVHNWPRLSPDGMRLVFQRVDSLRGTPDLWVKDLARGTETRVTVPPAHGLLPVWSPGGERLAFLWGRPSRAVVLIGAADGTSTSPARGCPVSRCDPSDWSPDGRTILVTANTANGTDVWSIPSASDSPDTARALLAEPFNERDARLSPDGEWVAYVSNESGREEVSVRRISGRQRTVLSSGGGHQPVWRRDGAELFFVDSQGRLQAVSIGRRARGELTLGHPVPLGVPPIGTGHWGTQYDVSRDGSRVFYVDRTQPEPSSRIEIILGWAELVR